MNELEQLTAVMIKDRKAITSSLNVAQVFHKRHTHVLRAIDNLKNNWSCLVEGLANFNGVKFEECFFCSSYKDATGRTLRAYDMNITGFTLLSIGFTGIKALSKKIAYITMLNDHGKLKDALKIN